MEFSLIFYSGGKWFLYVQSLSWWFFKLPLVPWSNFVNIYAILMQIYLIWHPLAKFYLRNNSRTLYLAHLSLLGFSMLGWPESNKECILINGRYSYRLPSRQISLWMKLSMLSKWNGSNLYINCLPYIQGPHSHGHGVQSSPVVSEALVIPSRLEIFCCFVYIEAIIPLRMHQCWQMRSFI